MLHFKTLSDLQNIVTKEMAFVGKVYVASQCTVGMY